VIITDLSLIITGKAWNDTLRRFSKAWRGHLETYLRTTKTPTLVLKYENLHTDLHTELERMMKFLEFPYTEDDLKCTIKSTIEGFHRKHSKNVTDPYAPDQRMAVLAEINLANELLRPYNISY